MLARTCLTLESTRFEAVQTDGLREVIDLCWGDRSAKTRQKVTSVIRAFWSWAEPEGHIAVNPASRVRRPRAERKVARVLSADARPRLLEPRDRLALFYLLGEASDLKTAMRLMAIPRAGGTSHSPRRGALIWRYRPKSGDGGN